MHRQCVETSKMKVTRWIAKLILLALHAGQIAPDGLADRISRRGA